MTGVGEKTKHHSRTIDPIGIVANQFFLIGGNPAGQHNPFEQTESLSHLHGRGADANIAVFGNRARTHVWLHPASDRAVYCWGMASHPVHRDTAALLNWCSEVIDKDDLSPLRELLGTFVIAIDDRKNNKITIINDVLGVRPFYVGKHNSRLVAGSDVLAICKAGLSHGIANYDAIAAWIYYNQPIDGQAVVTDYHRMPPMSVRTYRSSGELVCDRTYGPLPFDRIEAPIEQIVDESHAAAAHALQIQLRDHGEVNFPLSGGYDSRLLFAIASKQHQTQIHAATLCTRSSESTLAQQVASALGQPLQLLRGRSRILDLYDDPFAFTSGGFVTGRNLTSFLARRMPGMPIVSGFMGDGTMRGSMLAAGNAHFAKDDQKLTIDDQLEVVHKRFTMFGLRLHLLHKSLRDRIVTRAQDQLRQFLSRHQTSGKPLLSADLFSRHRNYYASVFQQYMDEAETIIPYASWGVLSSRVKYAIPCHNERNYPMIFARHYPQLANIPHTSQLPKPTGEKPPVAATRHLRRWSADLAAATIMTDLLEGCRKRTLLKLLPSGLLGESNYEREIIFAHKMLVFERSLRKNHIAFSWDRL